MSDGMMDVDELAEKLKVVGKAAESAAAGAAPTAPKGELEAALRKEGASGTLVRMANGVVIYIPVVHYTGGGVPGRLQAGLRDTQGKLSRGLR